MGYSANQKGFHLISPRIGHGYDLHRLQPGGQLVLGTIIVSTDISPVAHSDGDVVLHALVDALLGAIAGGDIGELFPNTDPQWKSADSKIFVQTVYAKIKAEGFSLINADLTISVVRPMVGEWLHLDAHTHYGVPGTAVAATALADAEGPVGTALQSLLIERTGGPSGQA